MLTFLFLQITDVLFMQKYLLCAALTRGRCSWDRYSGSRNGFEPIDPNLRTSDRKLTNVGGDVCGRGIGSQDGRGCR